MRYLGRRRRTAADILKGPRERGGRGAIGRGPSGESGVSAASTRGARMGANAARDLDGKATRDRTSRGLAGGETAAKFRTFSNAWPERFPRGKTS